jgi:hypothetical protein
LSNPLQVVEQITYLIFIKRLDAMQELEERKATTLGTPIERRIGTSTISPKPNAASFFVQALSWRHGSRRESRCQKVTYMIPYD